MVANETIKQKEKGWRNLKYFAVALICFSFLITGCSEENKESAKKIATDVAGKVWEEVLNEVQKEQPKTQKTSETQEVQKIKKAQVSTNVEGEMQVHFIDVGQADATLFVHKGQTMLFDAATKSQGDEVVEYIKKLGIKKLDVLVLTHPHDDHMGGSAKVLNNIEVGKIYGPDIFDIKSLDSIGWYNDMIDAVDKIDAKRNKGVAKKKETSIWNFPRNNKGEFAKFKIGDAVVEFYAPLENKYSDMNDYSICAKVSYGEIDVFLTGDATTNVEKALIAEKYDLDVEVFQASHHGSDTGNSKEFLNAISPETVVISCGMKNKHKHPIKSVMQRYKNMGIVVYRTDESGDIVMTTDGKTYSFNKKPGTYKSGAEYKKEK